MAAITMPAKPLKLGTLEAAHRHNTRQLTAELDGQRIDPQRTPLNFELVACPLGLTVAVVQATTKAGIDLTTRANKRHDKGVACEMVFSLSSGFAGDVKALFIDVLGWFATEPTLKDYPIVSAIVHMDEAHPHMHVIYVPIVTKDGKTTLQASAAIGYKGLLGQRTKSLYAAIGAKHGLTATKRLTGAAKAKATEDVLTQMRRDRGLVNSPFWPALVEYVTNNPDAALPFAAPAERAKTRPKKQKTFAAIMTSTGRKTSEDKAQKLTTSCSVEVAATSLRSCEFSPAKTTH
ncbi:MAG: plasmid recombination protein [Formosimonas sp.]